MLIGDLVIFIKFVKSPSELSNIVLSNIEERLFEYIVMLQGCHLSFMRWWKTHGSTDMINVRYLHSCHGNACKPSSSAKADSSSAPHFFAKIPHNSNP